MSTRAGSSSAPPFSRIILQPNRISNPKTPSASTSAALSSCSSGLPPQLFACTSHSIVAFRKVEGRRVVGNSCSFATLIFEHGCNSQAQASDSSVRLSKFSDLRLISRISFMIGSQTQVQKRVASRHPKMSPTNHAQQFYRLPHSPQIPCWIDRAIVIAGLMTRPASGANDLAMWQKIAILRYPESSLSMKLVLGFDRRSVNNTRMKTPIVQFEITLKISPPPLSSNGSSLLCPSTSLQNNPATAAENCARRQQGRTLALYLLSFLRQLERVMTGLILAPQSMPEKKMLMRRTPAACASIQKTETEHSQPQVKRKTAANSKTKSCWEVAMFMMLNSSWSNLLMVLSLRVLDIFSSSYSCESKRVLLIQSLLRINYNQIIFLPASFILTNHFQLFHTLLSKTIPLEPAQGQYLGLEYDECYMMA